MNLASLVIAVLALVVAIVSAAIAWRSGRSATRSAAAAERSATAAEQQVELATPPAIAFQFEHVEDDVFAIRNVGREVATGVVVERGWFSPTVGLPSGISLKPDEPAQFSIPPSGGWPLPGSAVVRCNELNRPITLRFPPRRPTTR